MRWRPEGLLCGGCAFALSMSPVAARALPPFVDSSYGRLEGDVSVAGGVGAAISSAKPRGEAELRLRYLQSAGLFATYEDAAVFSPSSDPDRALAVGVELRPLFLFRWLQGRELALPRWDLLVDSLGLELGVVWLQPPGRDFGDARALQAGVGLEVPVLEHASGPWVGIRGIARWGEAALGAAGAGESRDVQAELVVTVSWHTIVGTHVIDFGDEAPR